MESKLYLSLGDGVRMVDEGSGQVAFESPVTAFRPRLTLRQVTPGLGAALQRLGGQGDTAGALTGAVVGTDGSVGVGKLYHYLGRLDGLALLARRLEVDGEPLASLDPISPYLRYDDRRAAPGQAFVLSRFTSVRNEGGRLVMESPRGFAGVRLLGRAALAALFELQRPRTAEELGMSVSGLDAESALALLRLLANAETVVPSTDGALLPEDADPVLGQWSFHDMHFHTRSRLGRHSDPYGGTFPFKGKWDPPPVVRPSFPAEAIPLFRPDLDALSRSDVPFTQVLEKRASLRTHDADPLTLERLGEFLYRTARIKRQSQRVDVSFRPYPGAGALHPLEIYPVVDRCAGLASGLYHYDPKEHALRLVTEPNDGVRTLLQLGGATAMMPGLPQVLLVIAARFQRVQNKYQSVAYAAILKDVGCLYQTMYLVATAMGLAPCALGGGHSDLFAWTTGLDYFVETSVGEFVLGTIGPGALDAAGGEQWHTATPPTGG